MSIEFSIDPTHFTGEEHEDVFNEDGNAIVPVMERREYLLLTINDDDSLTLMNEETQDMVEDIRLPANEELVTAMKKGMEEGTEVIRVSITTKGLLNFCSRIIAVIECCVTAFKKILCL